MLLAAIVALVLLSCATAAFVDTPCGNNVTLAASFQYLYNCAGGSTIDIVIRPNESGTLLYLETTTEFRSITIDVSPNLFSPLTLAKVTVVISGTAPTPSVAPVVRFTSANLNDVSYVRFAFVVNTSVLLKSLNYPYLLLTYPIGGSFAFFVLPHGNVTLIDCFSGFISITKDATINPNSFSVFVVGGTIAVRRAILADDCSVILWQSTDVFVGMVIAFRQSATVVLDSSNTSSYKSYFILRTPGLFSSDASLQDVMLSVSNASCISIQNSSHLIAISNNGVGALTNCTVLVNSSSVQLSNGSSVLRIAASECSMSSGGVSVINSSIVLSRNSSVVSATSSLAPTSLTALSIVLNDAQVTLLQGSAMFSIDSATAGSMHHTTLIVSSSTIALRSEACWLRVQSQGQSNIFALVDVINSGSKISLDDDSCWFCSLSQMGSALLSNVTMTLYAASVVEISGGSAWLHAFTKSMLSSSNSDISLLNFAVDDSRVSVAGNATNNRSSFFVNSRVTGSGAVASIATSVFAVSNFGRVEVNSSASFFSSIAVQLTSQTSVDHIQIMFHKRSRLVVGGVMFSSEGATVSKVSAISAVFAESDLHIGDEALQGWWMSATMIGDMNTLALSHVSMRFYGVVVVPLLTQASLAVDANCSCTAAVGMQSPVPLAANSFLGATIVSILNSTCRQRVSLSMSATFSRAAIPNSSGSVTISLKASASTSHSASPTISSEASTTISSEASATISSEASTTISSEASPTISSEASTTISSEASATISSEASATLLSSSHTSTLHVSPTASGRASSSVSFIAPTSHVPRFAPLHESKSSTSSHSVSTSTANSASATGSDEASVIVNSASSTASAPWYISPTAFEYASSSLSRALDHSTSLFSKLRNPSITASVSTFNGNVCRASIPTWSAAAVNETLVTLNGLCLRHDCIAAVPQGSMTFTIPFDALSPYAAQQQSAKSESLLLSFHSSLNMPLGAFSLEARGSNISAAYHLLASNNPVIALPQSLLMFFGMVQTPYAVQSVAMTLSVRCLEGGESTPLGFVLRITPRSVPLGQATQATVSGALGLSIVSTGASSSAISRIAVLQRMMLCDPGHSNDGIISLELGSDDAAGARGAIVGNIIVVSGCLCASMIVAGVMSAVSARKSLVLCAARVHLPSVIAPCLVAAMPSSAGAVTSLLAISSPLRATDIVVCVAGLGTCCGTLIFLFHFWRSVTTRFDLVDTPVEIAQPLGKLMTFARWANGRTHEWRLRPWQSDDSLKACGLSLKSKYQVLLFDVRSGFYPLVDAAFSCLFGVMASLPTKGNRRYCTAVIGCVLGAYALQLIFCVVLRPLSTPVNHYYVVVQLLLGLIVTILQCAASIQSPASSDSSLMAGSNVCMLMAAGLSLTKTIADLLSLFRGLLRLRSWTRKEVDDSIQTLSHSPSPPLLIHDGTNTLQTTCREQDNFMHSTTLTSDVRREPSAFDDEFDSIFGLAADAESQPRVDGNMSASCQAVELSVFSSDGDEALLEELNRRFWSANNNVADDVSTHEPLLLQDRGVKDSLSYFEIN